MVRAYLRGRQIFKFGLLKKNNKKNLKIRLVFNRMVRAYFRPTVLIQIRSGHLPAAVAFCLPLFRYLTRRRQDEKRISPY